MLRILRTCVLPALCLLAACRAPLPDTRSSADVAPPPEGSGALSAPAPTPKPKPRDIRKTRHWPAAQLSSGEALVSCGLDYDKDGDGAPLTDLGFESVQAALQPCSASGVVRLRYRGKINGDFTDLVERVADMTTRLGIGKRVLDLDSTGGHVEDAMRSGDLIGGAHWTLWVREGAICHSACVLILAAGDTRMISGRVGIHRMIRIGSTATTRAELNDELQAVHEQMLDYLSRNGAASAIADLMMTVPNRQLRLLQPQELKSFGLDGANAAQDDLDRLTLTRECGEDFMRRRDDFARAFDQRCLGTSASLEDINQCGLKLRGDFGFPDAVCPLQSPLAEYDWPAPPSGRSAAEPPLAVPVGTGGLE